MAVGTNRDPRVDSLDYGIRSCILTSFTGAQAASILDRGQELAVAAGLIDGARRGHGSVLLVEGAAGIGKTRLLREIRGLGAAAGLEVLAGRGSELERRYAFGIIRQAVEPVSEGIAPAERERLLGGVVRPGVAAISGAPVAQGDLRPESLAVLNGLFWLLVRVAERSGGQGVMLAVDDLHWADEGSLELLSFLVGRVESVPLLVVATARPRTDEAADARLALFAGEAGVTVLRPRALGEGAVRALVAEHLGVDPHPEFARACLAVSGGNPFLLAELLRAVAEQGIEPSSGNTARVASLSPENVSRSVAGRLARLGEPATALAGALAVLGGTSTTALAAKLAGLDERSAAEAAGGLVRSGLLAPEVPLSFAHPLLRTAVESELSPATRAVLHSQAAELLTATGASAERVALHLLETEPSGDARAARLLAEAGRAAARRGAPETAARLLLRTLQEPPVDAEQPQLLFDLGTAESALGMPEAQEHLRQVAREAPDVTLRARALLDVAWVTGPRPDDQRDLLPLYERVAREVADRDRELGLGLEAARLGVLFINPSLSSEFAAEAERFRHLPGDTPAECSLLAWVARKTLMSGGTAGQVGELAERAAGNASLADAGGPAAVWFLHMIFSLIASERLRTAEEVVGRALGLAIERGSASAFASASGLRALVRHAAGDLAGCEADARSALDSGALAGFYAFQPLIPLSESLADQGRATEGEALLAEHGVAWDLPSARPYTALLIARGRLRAAGGDMQAASDDLCEAIRRLEEAGSRGIVGIDGRLEAALVLHASSETVRARQLSDDALKAAIRWRGPRPLGGALRVAGLLRGGDEGLTLLHKAVSTLRESPARLWYARALIDLGAALRRANQRRECRASLREGIDLAERCGAMTLAEHARNELRASGGRVPPRVGGSYDQLTPSERRVAELAAGGLSNAEIAQRLFVTIKTVEMHLSNSYRKLAISSRHELPGALELR